jgi:predicted alpha/beta-hydrolase family hydrolase
VGAYPAVEARSGRTARGGPTSQRQLAAVLAPGYGGTSAQPILLALAARLSAAGILPRAISYSRARPSGDYGSEVDDVRRARDEVLANGAERVALVGRSFGGRMCARLAAQAAPDALVLLGHPIGPAGRPRPEDEAALAAVRCPTLIVQGDRDALGPLAVLRPIVRANPAIELYILKGTGHQFGPRQAEAIERATSWLLQTLT